MSNFKPDTVTYVVRSELGSRINPEEKGARSGRLLAPPVLSLSTLRRKSVFGRDEAQFPEVERD
jgi:hypothetical protein